MEETDNELRTDNRAPELSRDQLNELLKALCRTTKLLPKSKYLLEARLEEEVRDYTQLTGVDVEGRPVTLPPGVLITATYKKWLTKPEKLRHDDVAEHLYRALHYLGANDANVIATTDGAWVSYETFDRLAERIALYNRPQAPDRGIIEFATEFTISATKRQPIART